MMQLASKLPSAHHQRTSAWTFQRPDHSGPQEGTAPATQGPAAREERAGPTGHDDVTASRSPPTRQGTAARQQPTGPTPAGEAEDPVLSLPVHRSILAIDIGKSTSPLRTTPRKVELRSQM